MQYDRLGKHVTPIASAALVLAVLSLTPANLLRGSFTESPEFLHYLRGHKSLHHSRQQIRSLSVYITGQNMAKIQRHSQLFVRSVTCDCQYATAMAASQVAIHIFLMSNKQQIFRKCDDILIINYFFVSQSVWFSLMAWNFHHLLAITNKSIYTDHVMAPRLRSLLYLHSSMLQRDWLAVITWPCAQRKLSPLTASTKSYKSNMIRSRLLLKSKRSIKPPSSVTFAITKLSRKHLLLTTNHQNVNYSYVIKHPHLLIGRTLVTCIYGLSWSILGSFVFFGLFRVLVGRLLWLDTEVCASLFQKSTITNSTVSIHHTFTFHSKLKHIFSSSSSFNSLKRDNNAVQKCSE